MGEVAKKVGRVVNKETAQGQMLRGNAIWRCEYYHGTGKDVAMVDTQEYTVEVDKKNATENNGVLIFRIRRRQSSGKCNILDTTMCYDDGHLLLK